MYDDPFHLLRILHVGFIKKKKPKKPLEYKKKKNEIPYVSFALKQNRNVHDFFFMINYTLGKYLLGQSICYLSRYLPEKNCFIIYGGFIFYISLNNFTYNKWTHTHRVIYYVRSNVLFGNKITAIVPIAIEYFIRFFLFIPIFFCTAYLHIFTFEFSRKKIFHTIFLHR